LFGWFCIKGVRWTISDSLGGFSQPRKVWGGNMSQVKSLGGKTEFILAQTLTHETVEFKPLSLI
jgi:hypothetical protein